MATLGELSNSEGNQLLVNHWPTLSERRIHSVYGLASLAAACALYPSTPLL